MQNVKYFKQHRMEMPLLQLQPPPELPAGFHWLAWDDSLLATHAEVKFLSFHQHEDSLVFPSLGTRAGCRELMSAIRYRDSFCPQATWLIAGPDGYVGTVRKGGGADRRQWLRWNPEPGHYSGVSRNRSWPHTLGEELL